MRKMFAGLIVAAFVLALGAPSFAKEATIKGQIVDVSCYNMDKANNAGKDHKMPKGDTTDCAIGCQGRPSHGASDIRRQSVRADGWARG